MNELMLRGFASELNKIAMAGGAPSVLLKLAMPLPPSVMRGLNKVPEAAGEAINLVQHAEASKPNLTGSASFLKQRLNNPKSRAAALAAI